MPRLQTATPEAQFCDNKIAVKDPDKYILVDVIVEKVLESWKDSILSFEFLNTDGSMRMDRELSPKNQARRVEVEEKIRANKPLERPILGIGLMDNIEIGSGRDIFMTLCGQGYTITSVHIRKSQEDEFKDYIV